MYLTTKRGKQLYTMAWSPSGYAVDIAIYHWKVLSHEFDLNERSKMFGLHVAFTEVKGFLWQNFASAHLCSIDTLCSIHMLALDYK